MYETENKKNMRGICDYCIIAIYYYHIYEWESIEANQDGKNGYIKVKTESGNKRGSVERVLYWNAGKRDFS